MLLEGTIDSETDEGQADPLEQEILLTKPELADRESEAFDVETVLNYTESRLGNARQMWMDCPLDRELGSPIRVSRARHPLLVARALVSKNGLNCEMWDT